MSPIAFLKQMLAKGMDLEAAMAAAEAFEMSAQEQHDRLVEGLLDRLAVDPKAERRRAKDRERKQKTCGIPRNSAETAESVEPQKEVPEPLRKTTPIPPLKGGTFPKNQADGFELWWEAYPRKVGKGLARKAYGSALRKTSAETLLTTLRAHRFDPDPKFQPHPTTWLNAERWEDGGPEPPPSPPPDADPWPRRMLGWRMSQYWHSDWGPKPGKPGYLGPAQPSEIAA